MPELTPEQGRAVSARGADLLVSAAAGAGKTLVLVERVVELVTGPAGVDVDRLLVVTYTEAAASELRARIGEAIRTRADEAEGPARLRLQLALLGRASISTLHSFCHSVCRRYFHRVDLDPAFEVMSEEEAALLQTEVLDGLFEELYERGDPGFLALAEAYGGGRGDEGLTQVVLKLHGFSRSHREPQAWLDQAAAAFEVRDGEGLLRTAYGRAAAADIRLTLGAALERLALAQRLAARPGGPAAYAGALADDAGRLGEAVRACGEAADWDSLAAALAATSEWPRLPQVKGGQGGDNLKRETQKSREKVKRDLGKLAWRYADRTEADLVAELRRLAGPMSRLAALVGEFDSTYRAAKDGQGKVDFSDLEHLCLAILRSPGREGLEPSDAAAELRGRYAEVLVDEYQDASDVQDAILRLVSRGDNLFLVGDMKQSIYRFRLADPRLFKARYDSYLPLPADGAPRAPLQLVAPEAGAGRRLDLPHNFRSRKPVIDAVNYVFRRVMREEVVELQYDEAAELRFAATYYGPDGESGPAVEVHLVERRVTGGADSGDVPGPDDLDPASNGAVDLPEDGADGEAPARSAPEPTLEELHAIQREAFVAADRIREMVEGTTTEPFEIWDKAENGGQGGYRPVRYRDVAVLLRSTAGVANLVVETFAQAGVRAYAQLSTGYFAAPEVETVLSLLRLIDNPRQDIPLAAVLRGALVGLSDDDLARLRLSDRKVPFHEAVLTGGVPAASAGADPGAGDGDGPGGHAVSTDLRSRIGSFLAQLDDWRTAARRAPLSGLVWRLLHDTGLFAYAGGLPNGAQRQANLHALYDEARRFDQFTRQGLARFLRFVADLRSSDADLGPPPPLGEGEDVVTLMSVHRSKGLEFPVVCVLNLGQRFNLRDATGDLLCHRDLGFGPAFFDTSRRLKYPSLAKRAVARVVESEAVAEEMRLLYVAMTRARDRLLLVGSARDLSARIADDWGATGGAISSARVARARSCLDWLVPALAGHPAGAGLRELAGQGDLTVAEDGSRWEVTLWGAGGLAASRTVPVPALAPEDGEKAGPVPWDRVRGLEPVDTAPAGRLTEALNWRYPEEWAWAAMRPAKIAPTELGRLLQGGQEEDAAAAFSSGEASPLSSLRPAFLRTEPKEFTPTERGKTTHLLLRHVDLAGALDEPGLTRLADSLVEREILTPDEAAAADIPAVARFFASDLGRWLVSRQVVVRRETPFSVGLPVGEVYADLRPGGRAAADRARPAVNETVLVQGIIDVVVNEPEGLTILDFKTDRVEGGGIPRRVEVYRPQVDLYRRAAEAIWRRPVREAWLYFLDPGVGVRCLSAGGTSW